MMTPFRSEFAETYIAEMLVSIDPKLWDLASYTHEMSFKIALPWEDDEILEAGEQQPPLELDICYEIWTAACLYDAVLNHTDYGDDCLRYRENYIKAVVNLEESLQKTKRKWFKKVPVYNLSQILQDAVDALDYILMSDIELDEPDGDFDYELSELSEEMRKAGKFREFEETIIDLQNRLSQHINEDDLKIKI